MDCKTYREQVIVQLTEGRHPTVEFLPRVDDCDQEIVLDSRMRAKLIDIVLDLSDADYPMYKFVFDMTDFMEYNKPFEQPNWWGKNETLNTARKTGNWPSDNQDELWLQEDNDPLAYFRVTSLESGLYEEYQVSGYEGGYMSWLEEMVLSARSDINRLFEHATEEEL